MKHIFLRLLCIFMLGNLTTASEEIPVDAQKEAIDIVAAISENLAALIIHHKNRSTSGANPEVTKQHSIELVKSITQAIALCITNAKNKYPKKTIMLYDQVALNEMIEQIALSITKCVQTNELGNI